MSSNELFRNREEVKGIKHTNPSPEVTRQSEKPGSHIHTFRAAHRASYLMHSKTESITLNRVRYYLACSLRVAQSRTPKCSIFTPKLTLDWNDKICSAKLGQMLS